MKDHEHTCVAEARDARPWNTNSDNCRQIFCAALQGIIARGAEPEEAVEFADRVVLAAVYTLIAER